MTDDDHRVTLVVPADPEYLRLARLAAADAGSRAGFDYEEIDDLRIAVNEMCHLLIGSGATGRVEVEFHANGDDVIVEGHSTAPGQAIGNEFTDTILSRVADEHAVTDGDDGRRFRLVKHRRP
jgi:anti-sigma regulatory factor (Ser/Thr protein kinase)